MLLAFDVGNTNIVVGCFRERVLEKVFRLNTLPDRTIDEYSAILLSLFERHLTPGYSFKRCVISSVVPPVTPQMVTLVSGAFGITPLVVGPGVKTGIAINTTDPGAVGTDRVVNAVAAKSLYGAPALVIDFGTATSFDVVSAGGAYEGGMIIPGIEVSLDALVRNTAKLPRVELSWPKQVVGKNTVAAMQSGAVFGYMCMIDGLVDKVVAEVGGLKHVIATGGLAKLFAEHSSRITAYDPDLTLKGLSLVAELHAS